MALDVAKVNGKEELCELLSETIPPSCTPLPVEETKPSTIPLPQATPTDCEKPHPAQQTAPPTLGQRRHTFEVRFCPRTLLWHMYHLYMYCNACCSQWRFACTISSSPEQTLKNLVNKSRQRITEVYRQLENRLTAEKEKMARK